MRRSVSLLVPLLLPLALLAPPTRAKAPVPGSAVLLRDQLAGFDAVKTHLRPEQADTAVEPSIAVNPANARNAVIGFQAGRVDAGGDATNGVAVTFDAGRTWRNGIVPGLTRHHGGAFDRASDAVVAFGPRSTVYYSSLVFDDSSNNGLRSAIVNSTSKDGGRTWGAPTVVQDDMGGGLNDKNWVVVDNGTGAGHHHGRVYVVWDRIAGLIAKYSDDQGATWVPASPVYLPNISPAAGIGAFPVVLPSGDLSVAFMADVAPPALRPRPGDELGEAVAGISKVVVATFVGAGRVPTGVPLPPAVPSTVATWTGNPVRHQRAGTLLAADADQRTGRLYVLWEDSSFRSDAGNDAVISWSDDGLTWSAPARVNPPDQAKVVDHYNPSVAVAADGTVDVIWRQRVESASSSADTYSRDIDTYLARSHDQGVTFGAPLKVDRSPSDTRWGAFSRGGLFQGDYDQVATAGGLTYVVRCESYAPSSRARAPEGFSATTPHHQTVWVAVVGAA